MSYLSWKALRYLKSKVDMLDYFHSKRFYFQVSAQKIINKEDKSLMKLLFCVNKSVAFIPLPLYFIRYTHQPIIKKRVS